MNLVRKEVCEENMRQKYFKKFAKIIKHSLQIFYIICDQ